MADSMAAGGQWRVSSRSAGNGACVEVAIRSDGAALRDSKDPDGPVLLFTAAAWRRFLTTIRTEVR